MGVVSTSSLRDRSFRGNWPAGPRIAEKLTLWVRTVNRHMADILEKLECASREDAIRLVSARPLCPRLEAVTRWG